MMILATMLALSLLAHAEQESSLAKPSSGIERFAVFNEKLKTAVCDEHYVSRAPSLETIGEPTAPSTFFQLPIPPESTEPDLISFLLGDSVTGFFSEHLKTQIAWALKSQAGEASAAVQAIKRRTALDICEALVNTGKFGELLSAKPSRFLEAKRISARGESNAKNWVLEVLDTEGRFGKLRDRAEYLIPGWVESFEVHRIFSKTRGYRRLSNPITNKTQSIEVMGPDGMPIGILFPSAQPPAIEWASYKQWAEDTRAREMQLEAYRLIIEAEALHELQGKNANAPEIRKLQEFYKNLLQAYQLYPDEKQFESYSRHKTRKVALDEVTTKILGESFLKALANARVNGSYVQFGLFKPDPKLHEIYQEYSEKLSRLRN